MNILFFWLGLIAFWSVVLTTIFRVEKRMVWPYGDLESAPRFPDPSGYGALRVSEALGNGFNLLGWAPDIKGATYKISYAMLVSKERDVFALIGVGSIVNVPLAATCLYTLATDARCFYSTDKLSAVQIDLSRHWTNQLVPNASFLQLVLEHRKWIAGHGITPRSFTAGRELAEFRNQREEHYQHMQRAGLIGFTDAAATHFRFTLLGAAKTAISGYFIGMARQLSQGRFPRNA